MYLLRLQTGTNRRGGSVSVAELEAEEDSMLEELSARIKVALSLPYTDNGFHSFHANGRVYMPKEEIGPVQEMSFETWEPAYEGQEEPDWWNMFYASDDVRLSDVFTVLGSTVVYRQDFQKVRIELVDYID